MLDKLVEKAERDGRYDDARKIERARDHLLRSSQAPQLTKVPSRHALESALQKLGFAETRKPLDEAISPPAKTFEPPRTSIKPRKEGKSVERLKNEFVEKLRLDDAEAEKRIKKRLELAKPKVPSRLASDQEAIATARLNDHNFKATLGAAEVDARALRNLNGLNWLNDDVIGFYIEMINARAKAEGRKLVGMNTFFYQKLSENGYTGVKRWTKRMKVDIFALDKFLIPINIGNMHWVCAVINFGEKRIEYYDSMKDSGHRHKVFETLRSYLQSEHKEKKGSEFDLGGWEDHYSPNTPRQHNGSDCGVFACQTLESAARGKDLAVDGFRFTGTNMAFFRKLMVIEIASGELSKRSWDP